MVDLVQFESAQPEANLAFDEALVRAEPATTLLRIWRNPPCVVVGRGQRVAREVDLVSCAAAGVPVLRRASGGGTVFQDLGNLNVTMVLPGASRPLRRLGELMTGLVADLGLSPELSERGVFVGGRKLCGFAELRTRDAALAHSTLLLSTPPGAVMRHLAPRPVTPHPLDSHRSAVTSLLAQGLRAASALPRLRVLLTGRLGTLHERAPEPTETRLLHDLMHSRYGYPPWHAEGRQRPAPRQAHDRNQEGLGKEEVWTARRASTSTG